jgi:hypothetical protein
MRKKQNPQEWSRENAAIGRRSNGEFVTESEYMDMIYTYDDEKTIEHAIKLDNTIIFWDSKKFVGKTNEGKIITIQEYDRLRRKARSFSHFYTKIRVGNEFFNIDNFMLFD